MTALSILMILNVGCSRSIDLSELPPIPQVSTQDMDSFVQRQITEVMRSVNGKPGSAKRNGLAGQTLHAYRLVEEADVLYSRAQALDPNNVRWPYYRALIKQKAGKLDEAVALFRLASELKPDNVIIQVGLADALVDLGEVEQARTLYEKQLNDAGDAVEIWHGYGRFLRLQSEHQASIEAYQKVIDIAGHFSAAYFGIAQNYQQLGQLEKARHYLTLREQHKNANVGIKDELGQELRRLDRSFSTRQKLARQLVARGRIDDAIKVLKKMVEEDPQHASTHISLIGMYTAKDDKERVEHHIAEARKIAADRPKLHFNIGTYHLKNARFQQAIDAYSTAAELSPEDTDILVRLGMSYEKLGDHQSAQQTFSQALEKNANHREANFLMGRQLAEAKRFADALPLLEKAAEQIDERRPVYLNVLARTQAISGDLNAARATINTAKSSITDSTSDELKARIESDYNRIHQALEGKSP